MLMMLLSVVPAVIVSLGYWSFLGHRSDYLGHFAAGYGGTLGALLVLCVVWPREARGRELAVGVLTFACMALGVGFEATVFKIAKFDGIDFCNQSLGAVMAGLIAVTVARREPVSITGVSVGVLAAAGFLFAGFHFAFA